MWSFCYSASIEEVPAWAAPLHITRLLRIERESGPRGGAPRNPSDDYASLFLRRCAGCRRLVRGKAFPGLRLPSCCGRYSRIVIGPRRGRATRAWVILLFLYSIRHGIAGAPGGAAVGLGRLVYLLGSKITSAKR